jgi:hypothetical protein
MELRDEYVIEALGERVMQQGMGLRTLVVECLDSEIFRGR